MRTLTILLFIACCCTAVHGAIIHVPADYALIQDAVQAALPGDTIEVSAGIYCENLAIAKSIHLVGEDRDTTIIDGQGLDTVINVTSDQVTLSGFTVRNSAQGWPHAGLLLNLSSNHAVTDNIFQDNWQSIHISETSHVDIMGNLFKKAGLYSIVSHGWTIPCAHIHVSTNEFKGTNIAVSLSDITDSSVTANHFAMYSYGNHDSIEAGNVTNFTVSRNKLIESGPITIGGGSNVTVSQNDCKMNSFGYIGLSSVSTAQVEHNYIEGGGSPVSLHTCDDVLINENTMNGKVSGYESHHVTISNNTMTDCEYGVYVSGFYSSFDYFITGNTITNPNLTGIRLDADNSHISGNQISHCGQLGIEVRGSTNQVYDNTIISCVKIGVEVVGDNNRIYHNNLISNITQANLKSGTGNLWDDGYPSGGNYWSDYQGEDQDGDGIGDTSYPINGGGEDRYPLMNPTHPIPEVVQNLDTGENFFTIQAAVDDPDTLDGHTVFVPAGTYYEKVTLHKSIHLQGEDMDTTFIDGAGYSECMVIQSPNTRVTDFTFRRSVTSIDPCVTLLSDGNLFHGNRIELCKNALHIYDGSYNVVTDNEFSQNTGTCVSLVRGTFNTISDNQLISNEGYGIAIGHLSDHNWVTGNHMDDGGGGITFSNASDNMVYGNFITHMEYKGIKLSVSHRNVIRANRISDLPGPGISLGVNNTDNHLFHNNFVNITEDNISIHEDSTGTILVGGYPMGGNYYDDHTGPDLYSGPGQNQPGADGIIDLACPIPERHHDLYPLVNPYGGLSIDVQSISAATGGTVQFALNSGPFHAARNYVILGSVSGVIPGLTIPNPYANTLPLNWDGFTNLMIPALNTPVFDQFLGQLDGTGTAAATLNTGGPLPPDTVGVTICFAYALYDLFDIVSNPVSIVILP